MSNGLALFAKLAVRNLARQRARTAFTLAAVVLGVTFLILTGGFVQDIFTQIREGAIHSQLGHLQIGRHGYFEHGRQQPLDFLIFGAQQTVDLVKRLPAVRDCMERLTFQGLLNNGTVDLPVVVEGVEPDKERSIASYRRLLSGRALRASDRYGVYVGEGVAASLHLAVGQPVTLLAGAAAGALNTTELQVVGVFRSFSKDYDAHAVEMTLSAAQETLQTDGANSIVVLLDNTSVTDRIADELRSTLGIHGLDVRTWQQLSSFYTKTVKLFKRQFGFLEIVVALLIVLAVMNAINLSHHERHVEFGTMRAMGNRNRDVRALILIDGFIIGMIGSALGVVLGVLLALGISAVGIPMPPPPNAAAGYVAHIELVPRVIVLAAGIGIFASVIAAIPPAIAISRMPLSEALRGAR